MKDEDGEQKQRPRCENCGALRPTESTQSCLREFLTSPNEALDDHSLAAVYAALTAHHEEQQDKQHYLFAA